jgi:hypothetical protein
MKFPKSTGEMQRFIDAAMEHASHAWGKLVQLGHAHQTEFWPPDLAAERTDSSLTAAYHVAVMIKYMYRVQQAMAKFWGTTEGQLCPYEDCAHVLALPEEGWYRCGKCGRPFFATVSDSDYEDYNCHPLSTTEERPPLDVPIARNLGPSWATPEKENA